MSFDFVTFLFGVYPFGSVTSQSLLDFSIVLLTLVWLKKIVSSGIRPISEWNWLGIEWAFLGYIFIVILGYVFNGTPGIDYFFSARKFVWILHLYILIGVLSTIQIDLKKLVQYFAFAFILPNLYALISFAMGYDLITKMPSVRILGLVNSATYHAHANAVIFVFFLSVFLFQFKKMSKLMRWISVVSLILFGLSIFLTFTRGIWISIAVSAFVFGAFLEFKKTAYASLIALALCFVAYTTQPLVANRVKHSFNTEANSERLNLFKVNVQIWKEYPLLGIGYGENLRRNREYWDRPEWNMPSDYITSHAHNQFLNVLSTTGVFGFIFFISFVFFFLKKNWVLLKKTNRFEAPNRYALLFSCLFAQVEFYLACLSDVTFEYAKIKALLILVWALVVALEIKPSIVKEDENVIR